MKEHAFSLFAALGSLLASAHASAQQVGGGTLYDQVVVVRKNAPLVAGTQDYTSSKINAFNGAIFLVSGTSADGIAQAHARISVGVCDDTLAQFAIGRRAEDERTTLQRTATTASNHVIVITDPSAVFPEARAAAVQVLSNGVRLNWESPPPNSAYKVTCILFGGSGNLAFADANQALVNPYTYTGAPFEADAYFFAGLDSAINANVGRIEVSIGFAANQTPIEQGSIGHNFPSVGSPTNSFGIASNTAAIAYSNESGSVRRLELTDFTPTGFVANNPAGNPNFICLGLKFAQSEAHVTAHDLTTSTGQKSFTTGIRPEFVMTAANLSTAYDTVTQTDLSASFGVSTFTNTKESSLSFSNEDNITLPAAGQTTNCKSYSDSSALSVLDHLGDGAQNASLYSLDSLGFTLDFSKADIAGKMIVFSIEKPTLP